MDLNLFKLCSCLKVFGYFMILLVAAIIAVTYYAVVIITWGPKLLHGGFKSLLSIFIISAFHILLVMLTWCYFMVVFRDPGSVPENWKPEENIEEGNMTTTTLSDYVSRQNSASTSEALETRPTLRFCNVCQNGKPPRCHHCSICQRCILKMDHHCIWVVNCVGACNYKFFLLFLLYTFLETTLDCVVLIPSFINFFRGAKHHSSSPGSLAVTFLAFDFKP
jgi:palmitoyltransferase